jgi:hypothetical protein
MPDHADADIFEWLSRTRYDQKQADILAQKTDGTGQCFLNNLSSQNGLRTAIKLCTAQDYQELAKQS